MGMFLEKGTKLTGVNLWMHVGGNPKEVEGVIGWGIWAWAWGIFVWVRVAARVVAGIPVACLGCGCLGTRGGEIRVKDESAGATLQSGTSFDVAEILDLTLDLVLRGLHYGWGHLDKRIKEDEGGSEREWEGGGRGRERARRNEELRATKDDVGNNERLSTYARLLCREHPSTNRGFCCIFYSFIATIDNV
jgi:hypothetical protein